MPEYVYIHETDKPIIGVWDDEKQEWSTEYVLDIQLDRPTRQLDFSLTKFAPVAYLQSKTTDYPYDSWYLRQVAD